MGKIILNDALDVRVLKMYLSGFKKPGRIEFFKENRSEILGLKNVELLKTFFDFGFHPALLSVLDTDVSEATITDMLWELFAENRKPSLVGVTKNERKEIVKKCAKSAYLIAYLRRTMLFTEPLYRMCLFESAVKPVVDDIFLWNVQNCIPLSADEAFFMFEKASVEVIKAYLLKVGCFVGGSKNINYKMLKTLSLRNDLHSEDKYELMLLSVNKLPIHTNTIRKLRLDGLLAL